MRFFDADAIIFHQDGDEVGMLHHLQYSLGGAGMLQYVLQQLQQYPVTVL